MSNSLYVYQNHIFTLHYVFIVVVLPFCADRLVVCYVFRNELSRCCKKSSINAAECLSTSWSSALLPTNVPSSYCPVQFGRLIGPGKWNIEVHMRNFWCSSTVLYSGVEVQYTRISGVVSDRQYLYGALWGAPSVVVMVVELLSGTSSISSGLRLTVIPKNAISWISV